jgi:hypothetical protein
MTTDITTKYCTLVYPKTTDLLKPNASWHGLLPRFSTLTCLWEPEPLPQRLADLLSVRRCELANTFEHERLVCRIQPTFHCRGYMESRCGPICQDELPGKEGSRSAGQRNMAVGVGQITADEMEFDAREFAWHKWPPHRTLYRRL